MKKLFVYMRGYGKECLLGPLFKLVEATFELFIPLIVAAIIDRGIGGGDRGYIILMCGLLAGLSLSGFLFSVTAQYFCAKAAVGFSAGLRGAMMRHISRMSYSDLDRAGESNLITLMTNDITQVQSGVNLTLRLLLRSPFIVFGSMVMAFFVDVKSALIFAVAIPVLSVVVVGIMVACLPIYAKIQSRLSAVLGGVRENLTGARVIRAFCREESEAASFDEKNRALTAAQKLAGRISALLNPLTLVMVNFAVILLIRLGALRVESGALTQGEVVALYNYMSSILVELIKLVNLIILLTKSVASAKRLSSELSRSVGMPEACAADDSPITAANAEGGYAVEFKNAALRYPGAAANAIEGINISVRRGETIGIIGGTGSGKTTLVNMIPRFYDVSEGAVLVDGRDVRCYPEKELRSKIGVVPQRTALLRGTLRSNLSLGKPDAEDDEIILASELAQAGDVIRNKGGLDAVVEENGRNFSGGQRQRLSIARALVKKPEILILDDSSSALDYATDAALRRSLRKIEGNPAVFIVSQRASSVRHADRIIVLDDGRVAGIGTHDELLQSCAVYREIYESQNGRGAVNE